MKHLKIYENFNEPIVGDYVICVPDNLIKNSESFFNNTFGRIIKKSIISRKSFSYGVEYENVPKFIQAYYCVWRYLENIIWFERDMIKYYGRTIEEIKMKMDSDKYNL